MQTIAESEKELDAAITLEGTIAGELADIEKALAEAESTAGARSLEARKTGDTKAIQKIDDEIKELHTRYGIIKSTHQAAREAVKTARHGIDQAQGADLRAQAAALTAQADERQKKTDKLLASLHEHEGINFVPQPQVTDFGVVIPNSYAVTNTMKLRIDADSLIQQAVTTEAQVRNFEPRAPTTGRKSSAVSPDADGHYPDQLR
jgi:hypothetical protein